MTGRPPQPTAYLETRFAGELQGDVVQKGRFIPVHETHQRESVVGVPVVGDLTTEMLPWMAVPIAHPHTRKMRVWHHHAQAGRRVVFVLDRGRHVRYRQSQK